MRLITKWLKDRRTEKGWTQAETADAIGIRQSRVAKLEEGEGSPSPNELARLVRAFGVPDSDALDLLRALADESP